MKVTEIKVGDRFFWPPRNSVDENTLEDAQAGQFLTVVNLYRAGAQIYIQVKERPVMIYMDDHAEIETQAIQ
jgi:hypothetical protein